ncbi:macro domain-containing protein [uncultured Polaribacter sp.]|uniref:type II toxin-antitoxin system antitoxin DNA ADP-ribosyl glycohydrolase DarG n=1 Tax=uncultured Polaribacter sp. TaxID=174711 RepID=UPI00261991E7|nr:macro domain-containing protein [uncultured Polaribacter sp.]
MITYTTGDLFEAQTEAIVNTVNIVGVMGKGIALQFKQRFPENYLIYKKACDSKELQTGQLLITESSSLFFKYIINFPTKQHWRNPSKYEYVEQGLDVLIDEIKKRNIKSVALPPLGAGNGKLEWEKVKTILNDKLQALPDVNFIIFEPQARFEARDNIKKAVDNLTPIRAMLLDSFEHYNRIEDSLNLLVAQKLAYFLQRIGEPLRLEYSKGWYGPYARNLEKVLQTMNGSYIVYEAQFNKPSNPITLVPERRKNIEKELMVLSTNKKEHLNTLKEFIYGFETAFGLELLATVDWIKNKKPELTYEEVHKEITEWTKRKASLIKLHHVKVAFNHLEKNKQLFKA